MEQGKGPQSQGSEPEPQQPGFKPTLAPTLLFFLNTDASVVVSVRACGWV